MYFFNEIENHWMFTLSWQPPIAAAAVGLGHAQVSLGMSGIHAAIEKHPWRVSRAIGHVEASDWLSEVAQLG